MENEEQRVEQGSSTEENSIQPEREPSQYQTAQEIAMSLGEAHTGAARQILHLVRALGRTQARALLAETLRIESEGGMVLPDGSRRRTPGGVFFHLAYTIGNSKSGEPLTRPALHRTMQTKAVHKKGEQVATPQQAFQWEDRQTALDEIGIGKGQATTVKITIIGQLGNVSEKGACIVGLMEHSGEKLPSLPKGLPAPQATSTTYVVYIASKQWKHVAAVAKDAEDAFIIEGFPQLDAATGSIAVFATAITSKKLQAAKKQPRQES